MFNSQTLRLWIQPQHLAEPAVQRCRKEFEANRGAVLVLRNFLDEGVAKRLSHFIINEAQYETLYGLYSTMQLDPGGKANVTKEQWCQADDKDRFFKLSKFVGISPELQLTPNLFTYLKFQTAFDAPDFRGFLGSISGLQLNREKATFHSFIMRKDDCLGWHTDSNVKNLLAFIFYLSPDWKPAFGGTLQAVDPSGQLVAIQPEYNSLAIFDVRATTRHRVTRIEPDAETTARATISGWIHKPDHEQQSSPSI
jgi:Rps23 Pro-64 3,4-dihydroxylase Tpa1-like proline 4-hydroxylase